VLEPGTQIAAYVVERRLGAGGMGEVYLAQHRHLRRRAAIKVLLPAFSANPEIVARFFVEARATAQIQHPSIVEILDCDLPAGGQAYIVMEYLEGESLGSALERMGRFAPDYRGAAAIAGKVAEALAAAHAMQIVHRDLKPENIFLARGKPAADLAATVKILDFGIAKLLQPEQGTPRTRTGSVMGTPAYMSPEQCRGIANLDHRTDIYSLGCVLFQMIAGRTPFVRELAGDYIVAHIAEEAPRLSAVDAQVPAVLDELVARMLAKDPAARPPSMLDIVAAVETFLSVERRRFETLLLPAAAAALSENAAPAALGPEGLPAPVVGGTAVLLPGRSPGAAGSTTFGDGAAGEKMAGPVAGRSLLVAAGIVATVGALAGLFLFLRPKAEPPARVVASPPVASPTPAPAAAVAPDPSPPPPPVPSRQPDQPTTVEILIQHAPPGTQAREGTRKLSLPLSLPADGAIHVVTFSAPGYLPLTLQVRGTAGETVSLQGMERRQPATVSGTRREKKDEPVLNSNF